MNPYHDEEGKFTSGPGGGGTIPKKLARAEFGGRSPADEIAEKLIRAENAPKSGHPNFSGKPVTEGFSQAVIDMAWKLKLTEDD